MCITTTGCIFGGSGLTSGPRDVSIPGETAAKEILKPLLAGACVDEHMQDQVSMLRTRCLVLQSSSAHCFIVLQMIILMTLAKGISRIKVGDKQLTCHTETAMKVAEIMLGNRGLRFNLSENTDDRGVSSYVLECQGCGLINEKI